MIQVRGITKTYPDGHTALKGIDLDVGEGMLGVLGPNGAGKTTFLSILMLTLQPSGGSRSYDGLDPHFRRNWPSIRRMIGFLPQSFSPIGHLTGLEYLVHCARMREMPLTGHEIEQRSRRLLDEVYLTEAAGRPSAEYSGGMRRRLGIAQALIHAPRLVVVDEPTAGLDPEERIRFRNLISDVSQSTAVLLSTHIVEDIEATCDRIAVIARGSVLFDDAPATLIRHALGKVRTIPAEVPLPPGSVVIGSKVDLGERVNVIYDDTNPFPCPDDGVTLEEAYSALLAAHGFRLDGGGPGA
ncbi:MAG TPA: ATP-binding cassette domain-containing protein [Thermoanaerobaculia bacterium]|nr:ATP-binding cassette domain-containing protein [Thermoanaerobaculia bacterium]